MVPGFVDQRGLNKDDVLPSLCRSLDEPSNFFFNERMYERFESGAAKKRSIAKNF